MFNSRDVLKMRKKVNMCSNRKLKDEKESENKKQQTKIIDPQMIQNDLMLEVIENENKKTIER